ncbi:MAG: PKD domain-containing protein [Gammaproteobacteria bacterium]|nr:PKD domain-containing protein [Gammaproteobacteria bacterium]
MKRIIQTARKSLGLNALSLTVLLFMTGCIGQLPEGGLDGAENMDIALAGEIRRESRRNFQNDIVRSAFWDQNNGVLVVSGFGELDDDDNQITVLNAFTRQILIPNNQNINLNRALNSDDDDNWVLRLNNLAAVPCSISVTTRRGVQNIPVQNAPLSCAGASVAPLGSIVVSEAEWKNSSARLTVKGSGAIPNQVVNVFDSVSGQYLGSDQANSVGSWRVRVRNVFPIPCAVSVSSNGLIAQAVVSNSPSTCSGTIGGIPFSPIGSFPGGVPPTTPNAPPQFFGLAPESVIQAPLADLTIPVGTTINFVGSGFDPDGVGQLSYRWSFTGTAFMQDRSGASVNVLFSNPGIYYVTLTATDANGLSDPTPATRLVIVQDTSGFPVPGLPNGGGFNPPEGYIVQPAQQQNLTVNAGQSISFFAEGFDADGNLPLTFYWDFGGAAPNMTGPAPGPVIFAIPGTYLVSMVVADSRGLTDPTPAYRTVTVLGSGNNFPGQGGQGPSGFISQPASDVSIPTGASVTFAASGYDPNNSNPLSYRWDFGGARPATTVQNPGALTFNTPGVYIVTMTVTNALGQSDLTPERRIITVGANTSIGVNNRPPVSRIVAPASNEIQIALGQSVSFAGTATDPDGDTQLLYRWEMDGAMPDIRAQNPGDIIFNQPGTYRIRFTATDSQGASDPTPEVVKVTVQGVTTGFNQPPNGSIIDPNVNMTISVGQSLSFSALGSDPEGGQVTFNWNFDGVEENTTGQVTPPITFNRTGTFRIRLTAVDNAGARDMTPDVRVVTVVGNNLTQPPIASIVSPATDVVIRRGDSINFMGSVYDPDSAPAAMSYNWDFGFLTGSTQVNYNTAYAGLVYFSTVGEFPVRLTVSDGISSDTVTRIVKVIDPTPALGATISVISGSAMVEVPVNFQVLNTTGGVITDYYWSFDGGAPDTTVASPSVTFKRAGSYNVALYYTDAQGRFGKATQTVNVCSAGFSCGGSIPLSVTPVITLPAQNNMTINVGSSIDFAASNVGGGYAQRWNFDGAVASLTFSNQFGSVVQAQGPGRVTFNRVGNYNVTLRYVDVTTGAVSQSATRTISVVANGGTPFGTGIPGFPGAGGSVGGFLNAVIQSPQNNSTFACGANVNFEASNISTAINYQWTFYQNGQALAFRSGITTSMIFYQAGSYEVTLSANDPTTGAGNATPDRRTFTVINSSACTGQPIGGGVGTPGTGGAGAGSGFGLAPNGNITSPLSDMTIRRNESVNFTAEGYDPSGASAAGLLYTWDFGSLPATGVQPNSQNAGNMTFTQSGVYVVKLTVRNASGVSDPTPSIRVITVLP